VTAYNNRGFSLKSTVSNAVTLGQSPAPTSVTLAVASATSLDVTWTDPSSALYQVDGYLVESYTSLPEYEVQVITSSSSSSLDEIQRLTVESDDDNLAGFFKLEFDGETTDNIAWNANAVGDDSVAIALARLSTVGEVEVSRMASRRVVQGLRVSTLSSSQIVTVVEGNTDGVLYGDRIWISNKEFTVAAVTSSTIDIGANFDEEDIANVKVYKWTHGYTWDITFTTQIGDQSQIIPSSAENWAGTNPVVKTETLREGVAPLSGTFRVGFMGDMTGELSYDISAAGMEVAIESLATIGDVSVERFRNSFGYDWRVTFMTELFDLPDMYIVDASLAGPFAKCDVSTASDGVVPDDYSATVVSGADVRSTTLSGLTMGTRYQIRVRAHNDEGYSYSTVSSPSFLAPKEAPSSPFNVTMFPLSEARLKVVWMAPQSDGGDTITRYRIEWDISDSFSNVGISSNSAEFAVMAGDGPFFCQDIDVPLVSNTQPRYARVFAYNGFAWSFEGLPSPRSAVGGIRAPGAPISVKSVATSASGIMVSWGAPSSDLCEYGGDGGSPVTHYVVEWDLRDDFASPAEFVTLYNPASLMYEIGGRDILTGEEDTTLLPGREYFIRITAFNSKGAGVAGYADVDIAADWEDFYGSSCADYAAMADAREDECTSGLDCGCGASDNNNKIGEKSYGVSADIACCACKAVCGVTTVDQLPSSPENITLDVLSSTSLHASWDHPVRDGGATLEKYRLMVSSDSDFEYYETVDLPIVAEVQTVVAHSDVEIEVQAIRMTAEVTNERQIIRTKVNAKDEIQTVTTHCDDVVNEVQRVTTSAVDINEVQLIELVGTDVDEVQLIQTYTEDAPEIQTVEVSTPRVSEEQIFGIILNGIDTSSGNCGSGDGAECANVEAAVTGTFKLQFEPYKCGTDTGNSDTNWCMKALDDAGIDGYECSDTSCMTAAMALSDSLTDMKNELCDLRGTQGTGKPTFMTHTTIDTNDCLTITKEAMVMKVGSTDGVYKLSYRVVFNGDFVRGNVPALEVYDSSVTHPTASFLTQYTYASDIHTVGDVRTEGNVAFTDIEGNQPDGVFKLEYECESSTVPVFVNVTEGVHIKIDSEALELYQFIRIMNSYHQIIAINDTADEGRIYPAYSSNEFTTNDAEVGFFYSDPYAFDGVSEACNSLRVNPTFSIDEAAASDEIVTKLRGLSDVINDDDDSLEISRSHYPADSTKVGYIWTITFHKQHGDLNTLGCDQSNLNSTNTASTVDCIVDTIQPGSFLGGNFSLILSFPHAYNGEAVDDRSDAVPYNIDPTSFASVLSSANNTFGDVEVERSVYIPDGFNRWTGGYIWTVAFKTRNGDIPTMQVYTQLTTTNNTAHINVGTQSSPLAVGDPGTAVEGNQVGGFYGLTFVDHNGTLVSSGSTAFPVVSPASGEALNASEFEQILYNMFDQRDLFDVTRSATPNSVMGYTYTVEFTGRELGGNTNMFQPVTTSLTKTGSANAALGVGELCDDDQACNIGAYVVNAGVGVTEHTTGAQVQGAFQLVYGGYSTGSLPYDAEAAEVEMFLNNLPSISPSEVTVTRDGPMTTPSNQVFGYVWSITFASNTWVDPTIDHGADLVPGNWVGAATTWDAVWDSGYSKAWGKNVGDNDMISCTASALYTTNGAMPTDGCLVEEVIKGTAPLHGSFNLELNTTDHLVINIQRSIVSGDIVHNAAATATDSESDGTSMEEILEAMDNIGDVEVSRSEVNVRNGGYTWSITFLRDKDSVGGQWGDQCEQKDTRYGLCNSPGNVPKLEYIETNLLGNCISNDDATYQCTHVTILDEDNDPSDEPSGPKEVQRIFINDNSYDDMSTESFRIHFGASMTDCIYVGASAAMIQDYLHNNISELAAPGSRGVEVTTNLDTVSAPNGQVITIYFFDEGDVANPGDLGGMNVSNCHPNNGLGSSTNWTATVVTVLEGEVYGMTAEQAGVQHGVVQRGNFDLFYVTDETAVVSTLDWNSPPEGENDYTNTSIKSHLEDISDHVVNVTREVIGKYGVVEYEVRFVFNLGFTPPGSGDIPILTVHQENATDNVQYPPDVYEYVKGSEGLGGVFNVDLHSPAGARLMSFDESASRLKRKLEEMTTVGVVHISRSEYPAASMGGWGDILVSDNTRGGYEWQVFFLKNPGTHDGFSFPPGSGNIDPLTVTYDPAALSGANALVETVNYVEGSTPIDGSFTLQYDGETTEPVRYNQQPFETKFVLESLQSIGEVTTDGESRLMERIPGLYVKAPRDSNVLIVEYNSTEAVCGDIDQCPPDIRQFMSPGDMFRVGGAGLDDAEDINSLQSIDGATFYSLMGVTSDSPLLSVVDTSADRLLPMEKLRLGADNYELLKTGVEVQVISIACGDSTSDCGNFRLELTHSGLTDETDCFARPAAGTMSTAQEMEDSFSTFRAVTAGDISVTRLASVDSSNYVFSIYFSGDSVLGNVADLVVSNTGCSTATGTVQSTTMVEGGYTAVQNVRTNVESGYIDGGFFTLQYGSDTTECIDFGAEGNTVADELNALPSVSERTVGTIDITSGSTVECQESAFGIVEVGSVISISDVHYDVIGVAGNEFTLSNSDGISVDATVAVGANTPLILVQDGVHVSRHGTGNSTSTVITLTETADDAVAVSSHGYYKLKVSFEGEEYVTSCINYHATAAEMKAAFDALQIDFNGDSANNDDDHVTISRMGDGTATSGYGYEYKFLFNGPELTFGASHTLGASKPSIMVVDEGAYGGCTDLTGDLDEVISLQVNASTLRTESNVIPTDQVTMGSVKIGDRIRIPSSLSPVRTFVVTGAQTDGSDYHFTLDAPVRFNITGWVTIYKIDGGVPDFSVQTRQEGEDSYNYDVFFSGRHLGYATELVVARCSNDLAQFNGMRWSLDVDTVTHGGSFETQNIALTSSDPVNETHGAFFKFVAFGHNNSYAVAEELRYEKDAAQYATSIDNVLISLFTLSAGPHVDVTVSGTGSREESYGYTYHVAYLNDGNHPHLEPVMGGGISSISYSPSDANNVDDLTVSGTYTGADERYHIVITHTGGLPNACDYFDWWTDVSPTKTSVQMVAGTPSVLSNGISVEFGDCEGHSANSSWTFVAVSTSADAPASVSITSSTVRDGASTFGDIPYTADVKYKRESSGFVEAYKTPLTYRIEDQSVEVFELSTKDPASIPLADMTYAFAVTYGGATVVTSCVSWDAFDYEIEAVLSLPANGLCAADDENCITVTRGEDQLNNPGGYVYTIYYESETLAANITDGTIVIDGTGTCTSVSTHLSMSKVSDGSEHTKLSRLYIPLGRADSSDVAAVYRGSSVDRVPLYKVNGNYWSVSFTSNIGNVPGLVAEPTKYLSEGTELNVYDDVVQGVHPLSHQLDDLLTGINYGVRVDAYTRGTYHGYSSDASDEDFSAMASAIPFEKVNYEDDFVVDTVPAVDEVQELVIYATHVDEIQTITTSATPFAEVQEFVLTTPESNVVAGNFAVRLPEVQVITLKSGSIVSAGTFSLTYKSYSVTSGSWAPASETTSCMSFDATAADVEAELELLTSIDDVDVVRSGSGGYSSFFGYGWTVSFVGNKVAGNVQQLEFAECVALAANTNDAELSIMTTNHNAAFGTDTEIQTVVVAADAYIAEGQYQLTLDYAGAVVTTGCIEWNATADELATHIEALANVDSVFVERYGSGSSASDYGYTYSIFFDGNAMHDTSEIGDLNPSDLTVTIGNSTGACNEFSHFLQGVLTDFTDVTSSKFSATVTQTLIEDAGYDLNATTATADDLKAELDLLPSMMSVDDTRRSLSDDRLGLQYTVLFDETMGNVPSMVCGMDNELKLVMGSCYHDTVIDGNYIGGYFLLGASNLLASNVSAADMETALELLIDVGDVSVTRSDADNQGGFVWSVTWLSAIGDVAPLKLSSSLTGSGVSAVVNTVQDGNYLGGTFNLEYLGTVTNDLAFDASADDVKDALEANVDIGLVDVTKTEVGTEGGSSFLITFRSVHGDVTPLVPFDAGLSGVGAVASIIETTKGSHALGTSLKLSIEAPVHCSYSQVVQGVCGSPIDHYAIEIGSSKSEVQQTISIPADYSVQRIRVAAESLLNDGVYEQTASGFFRLSYNGQLTAPISSAASADDMRHALEALTDVTTVRVTRDMSSMRTSSFVEMSPGLQYASCVSDSCDFKDIPAGEFVNIGGEWFSVADTFSGSDTQLPLALATDSSVATSYGGEYRASTQVFRFARGNEWTVTFLKVNTDSVVPMESPKHGLIPLDSTVSIRGDDCRNCTYISGLTAWTEYYSRLRAHNEGGYSDYTEFVAQTPQEIPGAPASLVLEVLSGTEIEAFFLPPAGADGGDISRYTIHWDTDELFSNALGDNATCATSGFGQCEIEGSTLESLPPYSYLINNLSPDVRYYVRIAARNSIPVQQIDPTGDVPDNTRWSETASAMPSDQPPSAPYQVLVSVSGKEHLQLLISPPISNGGSALDEMFVEWDESKSFNSAAYGSANVSYDSLVVLYDNGPTVYEISGLNPGTAYWVRVSVDNVNGASPTTTSLSATTPAGEPNAPAAVTLSHATTQDTPITEVEVAWAADTTEDADGGSPITGYLVEWWEERPIHEVQLVRFTSDVFPPTVNGSFALNFGPSPTSGGTTGLLTHDISSANLRSQLINIGYIGATGNDFVISDVSVQRSLLPKSGYEWLVTFESTLNQGDMVSFEGTPVAESGEYVDVIEMVGGSRVGGFSEVQVLQINSVGSNRSSDLGGWFRLAFNGTQTFTSYLSHDIDSDDLVRALEQLSTIRQVSVSKSTMISEDGAIVEFAGNEWKITFSGDIGDQPVIYVDTTYLVSTADSVSTILYDGDNSVDAAGFKASEAFPGEMPAGYNSRVVDQDTRTFTIDELVPGTEYFVAVSAINAYGTGPVTKPDVLSATPPQQKPQPPTDVSVFVNTGSATSLKVDYDTPDSDGGAVITKYRIELDNVNDFSTAIYDEVMCDTANVHTAYKIWSEALSNDPIVSGTFKLGLSVNGNDYVTDFIPYDATARKEDEVGFTTVIAGFTVGITSGSNILTPSVDVSELIFKGDRIKLSTQLNEDEVFEVTAVSGSTSITLDNAVTLDSSTPTLSGENVLRYAGGRGTTATSRVACKESDLCSLDRRKKSGSIESKLEFLTEAITLGVEVDRDEPDNGNGFIWRVTFLDNSPSNPYDFTLSISESSLLTQSGAAATMYVSQLIDGESYSGCTDVQIMPGDKALTLGEAYYARVLAYNSVGYSLPQVAPAAEKPMVVPGKPTSVVLTTVSKCDLRVTFNPPDSDGGDTITEYLIEYSVNSDFSDAEETSLKFLEGGAPYHKTISGLIQGTFYFVRVSAKNSQDYGAAAISTPASLQPYEASSAPTGVYLRQTSNSMLTVSFFEPLDNGGDEVKSYIVEWDTSSGFNGVVTKPHKDSVELDATEYNSYTIPYLTEGTSYYVRVFAVNSAGESVPAASSPTHLAPVAKVPGKPHTITAVGGVSSGTIVVTWQRPRIPWHEIPCSGTLELPDDCPTAIGGGLPVSNGGADISSYLIEYNDKKDFTGKDKGKHSTAASTFTIQDLTPGRQYYMRVLAVNENGPGNFCSNTDPNCLITSAATVITATATVV